MNGKYGIMLIDENRASQRIYFDKYMSQIKNKKASSQGILFPDIITLAPSDQIIFDAIIDDLHFLGFDIADMGKGAYAINGIPTDLKNIDINDLINSMIDTAKNKGRDVKSDYQEQLAFKLADAAAIPYGHFLSVPEIENLIDELFASTSPNYTSDGKIIISVMGMDEISKKFK